MEVLRGMKRLAGSGLISLEVPAESVGKVAGAAELEAEFQILGDATEKLRAP